MKNWNTVRLVGPDNEDGSAGPVEWEVRLPLAGMSVDQSHGAAELMMRLQQAGDEAVAPLASLGLVPDCRAYREHLIQAIDAVSMPKPVLPPEEDIPCWVTLSQMAAIVQRSKRTLQKAKGLPKADVKGGGGKANYWEWDKVRPWLADRYGKILPKRFPADRLPPRPGEES